MLFANKDFGLIYMIINDHSTKRLVIYRLVRNEDSLIKTFKLIGRERLWSGHLNLNAVFMGGNTNKLDHRKGPDGLRSSTGLAPAEKAALIGKGDQLPSAFSALRDGLGMNVTAGAVYVLKTNHDP